MKISDITYTYTIDKALKNSTTGMIDEVIYTFSGTASGETAKIANNKQILAASDPSSDSFIDIASLTKEQVIAWIDESISEVVTFDIEELRVTGKVGHLEDDDPKHPANQDLSNFRHSSRKEQMQENIRLTIEKKLEDKNNSLAKEEHIF